MSVVPSLVNRPGRGAVFSVDSNRLQLFSAVDRLLKGEDALDREKAGFWIENKLEVKRRRMCGGKVEGEWTTHTTSWSGACHARPC